MIWRRVGSTTVGASPPPIRSLYPDWDNFKVWTRVRTKSYTNGSLTIDSGWSVWSANAFPWPSGGAARDNGTTVTHTDTLIETAGRYMPWQLVIEDRIQVLATGATTFTNYTVDMLPGVITTFAYSTTTGTEKTANKHMLLVPAEGV